MTAAVQIATRHFGKRTVNTLAKRGITFLGLQAIPDMRHPMPEANAETGYVVDDNGTGRVWTYADVKKAEAGVLQ